MGLALTGHVWKRAWRPKGLTHVVGFLYSFGVTNYLLNSMKKYFLIVLLMICTFPSIAFAAWWNPFSWFDNWNFSKKETSSTQEVEIQEKAENKINELQAQIDELKNKQQESVPSVTEVTASKTIKSEQVSTTSSIPPAPAPAAIPKQVDSVPIPPQWLKPDGSFYTPEEMVENIEKELKKQEELKSYDYDIYNVSQNSGNTYTPEQMNAIDCAYYNIGCPTLDVRIINR